MAIVMECASCGKQYPATFRKDWGKTRETNGFGPTPMCTALVDGSGPKAPDGSAPQEVCAGPLAAVTLAIGAPAPDALTPNF